jgi:hypothetical protein
MKIITTQEITNGQNKYMNIYLQYRADFTTTLFLHFSVVLYIF